MMIKTHYLLLVIFVMPGFVLNAQEFAPPKGYKLESRDDYKPYEPDVLKCIEYLESRPQDEQSQTAVDANAFLLKWLSGVPYISIELNSYVTELSDKNPSFILVFMGGWAKFSIMNMDDKDKMHGQIAGVRSILKVYKNGLGVKKDKKIDKLIKLDQEGKLESWINEQVEKDKQK